MPSDVLSQGASRELPRSIRGVFCGLLRWRKAQPADPRIEAMSAARAKRDAALKAYREARVAGDTRRMNEAHRSLRHATTDLVRLELGR